MNIFKNKVFKILAKIFFGILITIIIELFFGIVVYRLVPYNVNSAPFLLEYPLLAIFVLSLVLVFWKKQYALTVGLWLGFLVFMLLMMILFEVLAGPATL